MHGIWFVLMLALSAVLSVVYAGVDNKPSTVEQYKESIDESFSELLRHPRAQQLQGRILNNAQFVQHSENAQSFYLPPDLSKHSQLEQTNDLAQQQQSQQHQQQQLEIQQQPLQQQQQPEIIQVQVPTDEKKIVLRLPPQQPPLQQQQQQQQYAYQTPPRRHYKIILVRSPPIQKAPPVPVSPEVEEQTLIYVLVKKPDEPSASELQALQQMQQDAVKFNKPEVYFIKYKANEQQRQQQQSLQPVSTVIGGSGSDGGGGGSAAIDGHANGSASQPQFQQEQISNINSIIQRQLQRNNAAAAAANGNGNGHYDNAEQPINENSNGYP